MEIGILVLGIIAYYNFFNRKFEEPKEWPFSLRVCTYEISHKISLIQICRDRKHEYRSPIHSIFV